MQNSLAPAYTIAWRHGKNTRERITAESFDAREKIIMTYDRQEIRKSEEDVVATPWSMHGRQSGKMNQ